jgi:fructose-1,6-bisphosphatase/inositol monophosphatase family enzyme
VEDADLLAVLHRATDAVVEALGGHDDWGPSGRRPGQYVSDLAADRAAIEVLEAAGLRVLSEESGLGAGDGPVAVLDPLDGSTNASRDLPWFATSICVVDDEGPKAAVVHDHPSSVRFDALRGGGARRDGEPLARRGPVELADSIVVVNGLPDRWAGWDQFRCMGAAALDLCAVADGRFDAFVDYDVDALGPWDYLGGVLVCREVGIEVVDAFGRDLVVLDHSARRTPVAAPSSMLAPLVEARADAGRAEP